PGPAYLWQVVKQLAMEGVNLEAVQIEVMGLRGKFENAAEFMNAIDPSRDGDLFNAGSALNACERYLRDKRKAERKGARARRG
ncbi:MAG: hypothetical protein KC635_14090, partial [Myxococcales bacterium]|nr:hypothetical protein [Myxococcales bacterium]